MNSMDFIVGLCETIAAVCLAIAVLLLIGNSVKAGKAYKKNTYTPPPNEKTGVCLKLLHT